MKKTLEIGTGKQLPKRLQVLLIKVLTLFSDWSNKMKKLLQQYFCTFIKFHGNSFLAYLKFIFP